MFFGGDDNWDPVEAKANELKIQSLIVDCMTAEGFEYFPEELPEFEVVTDEDQDLWKNPQAYGQKYGYGVAHGYETWGVENIENQNGQGEEEYVPTPNDEYAMSLSPAESEIYYEVLYGENIETIDENGDIYYTTSPDAPGCYNSARTEIDGKQMWDDPDFNEAFDNLSQVMQADERLRTVQREWRECFAETIDSLDLLAGQKVDGSDDMYGILDAEIAVLTGQRILPLDPDTGEPIGDFDDSYGWSSTMDEDGNGYAMVGEQHLIPTDQLETFRQRELDIWQQDFDCQNQVGLAAVQHTLEQEMVDQISAQFPNAGQS